MVLAFVLGNYAKVNTLYNHLGISVQSGDTNYLDVHVEADSSEATKTREAPNRHRICGGPSLNTRAASTSSGFSIYIRQPSSGAAGLMKKAIAFLMVKTAYTVMGRSSLVTAAGRPPRCTERAVLAVSINLLEAMWS
ncbi:hypothetical protein EVAR_48582_1 [Eumeta japonica]|uniref:Uncharacterized protein n=1 Tax=Eumeta variegata TaxID=151549 RepID=A0A4C1XD13_EUMVA|nr:hypothetical protein EVAR_48582_1 [Eumeta japonica]